MPYDPRKISEGGNRGIDEQFSRKAPQGKFRVISVDTFDGGDWVDGDYDSLQAAQDHVREKTRGQQMLKMHIYEDTGKHLGEGGSF
jgi:hypothetical protein